MTIEEIKKEWEFRFASSKHPFHKDVIWNWIEKKLKQEYQKGREDEKKDTEKEIQERFRKMVECNARTIKHNRSDTL